MRQIRNGGESRIAQSRRKLERQAVLRQVRRALEPPRELGKREKTGKGANAKVDKMSIPAAHNASFGRNDLSRNSGVFEGPSSEAMSQTE